MFKPPSVETILYPEFSRSNRQANICGRTMDAGNYRLLLTSSPAYYNFLETTENYTLQTQRKNQVCLSLPRVPGPTSPGPTSPGLTSPGPTSPSPTSPGPTSTGSTSPGPTSPGPSPHVPVPLLVTAAFKRYFQS